MQNVVTFFLLVAGFLEVSVLTSLAASCHFCSVVNSWVVTLTPTVVPLKDEIIIKT